MQIILSGKAKLAQNSREGIYVLSNKKFNGLPVWEGNKNENKSKTIRFEKEHGKSWYVGEDGDRGSQWGGLAGPKDNDLFPHEIQNGWRYRHSGYLTDANQGDVVFKIIGNTPIIK